MPSLYDIYLRQDVPAARLLQTPVITLSLTTTPIMETLREGEARAEPRLLPGGERWQGILSLYGLKTSEEGNRFQSFH